MKNIKEGKYRRFIAIMKQLSIIIPLIEALEKMSRHAKFMKDLATNKRAISFENEECNIVVPLLLGHLCRIKRIPELSLFLVL